MTLVVTTSLPSPAQDDQGEEAFDLYTLGLKDLLNVKVISASKLSQKVSEAPSAISAFQRKQIETYGWMTINELLYTQPGFGPSHDYDRPTVASRGNFDSWSNNHILHLVDGIPFNGNLYGTAFTWLTPTFNSKSIEVIRGPGSALYGSSATNGVVQLNTLDAVDLNEKSRFKFGIGSDNTSKIQAISGIQKKDIDIIFAISTHRTDGNEYSSYDGSNRIATLSDNETGRPRSERFTTYDNRSDNYFWTKVKYKDDIEIQYHRQEWSFQTGHGWVFWIPDEEEDMDEDRNIFSLKYITSQKNLNNEFVIRYQNRNIRWNQRYYPDGAFMDYYPNGMWEFLDTDASDVFARAQLTYHQDDKESIWLLGVEVDRFSYDGDNAHTSNIDVDSPTAEPFPNNETRNLGSWLDFIKDEPLINTGIYLQYNKNNFLKKGVSLTLGGRWDRLGFDFNDIYDENTKKSKSFARFSPRIALVYAPQQELTYKFFAGKAFRAPTPTELAGAHTFSLASNINELKPELLTTYEFQADADIDQSHTFRGNIFWTEFENQVAYSTVNFNLSTNVNSTQNAGIELELFGNYKHWNWFANLSYTKRLNEDVLVFFVDETNPEALPIPEFTGDDSNLKWEPNLKINLGLSYESDNWNMAATLHHHGEIQRRDNEVGNPGGFLPLGVDIPSTYNLDDHRNIQVQSWNRVDFNFKYRINRIFNIQLKVQNLLNEEIMLIKTGPFPFDYRQNDQHFLLFLESQF